MSEQIDAVESHFDKVWDNLRIYRLPLHIALFVVLSAFERLYAFSSSLGQPIAITRLRQGLQLLVPELFARCRTVPVSSRDMLSLRQRNFDYPESLDALNYAQRHNWIAYHLTGYRLGWFNCEMEERIIKFSFTGESNAGQSLVGHRLKRYCEDRRRDAIDLKKVYKESPPEEITESLELALRHARSERLLDVIPRDVFGAMRNLVVASAPIPTIERDINFSGYTVQDYYDFWTSLSALMFAFLEACDVKYGKSAKRLINKRVVIAEVSSIVRKIRDLTDIPVDSCNKIVNDLVLDVGAKRPDIQVQPLVATNAQGLLLLSPSLIFTSNWEVCLLRNWGKLSPDKYGEVVGSKKVRLANELALLLEGPGVKQAINKKVAGSDTATDVDLALFDSENGYLEVIQLKWLIEPDSFQEESHAREDLLTGIEQLKKCISLFTDDRDKFIFDLFPQDNIGSHEVTDVQFILLSRGFFDFAIDARQLGIDILDYEITCDSLKESSDLPTSEKFRKVVDWHHSIERDTRAKLRYNGMKIAGYLCQTPGLATSAGQSIVYGDGRPKSPHVKSPCFCGSGMRYGDCCKIVESLDEEDSTYVATIDGSNKET